MQLQYAVRYIYAVLSLYLQIAVEIANVPAVGSYSCVFGDLETTPAVRRNSFSSDTGRDVFDCWTPALDHLPGGQGSTVYTLYYAPNHLTLYTCIYNRI